VAPVAVGTAVAEATGGAKPAPALAALAGAGLLQVASNFANDVFDHEKGADTAERVGPVRATQAGLLTPKQLKLGMLLVLALATVVGAYLVWVGGLPIVAIGVASMLSAVAYTGGPFPLGYHGLGDAFVFGFFGLVAVAGTAFVQTGAVSELSLVAALPVGALATAVLVVNNVRDRVTDTAAGKRTLAVRFGRRAAELEYLGLLALAYATPFVVLLRYQRSPFVLLPLATLPLAALCRRSLAKHEGRALNPLLGATARLALAFGVTFAAGLALPPR
jgi:1,4-dihydroxy-2-naphthoate octaprenyltransferase